VVFRSITTVGCRLEPAGSSRRLATQAPVPGKPRVAALGPRAAPWAKPRLADEPPRWPRGLPAGHHAGRLRGAATRWLAALPRRRKAGGAPPRR
jgi:hypothetical protein